MNNMADDQSIVTPKKRSKLAVFGGIGCLLMLLLLVFGVGALFYFSGDLSKELADIEGQLTMSAVLEEEIGSPIKIKPNLIPEVSNIDDITYTTISGIVSGPDGEGAYKARLVNEGVDYELESLTVDVNGTQIDLSESSDDEEIDLGIDLGE